MAYKLPALMLALAACGTVSNDDPSAVSDDQPTTTDPTPEGTAFRFFTSSEDGTARTDFDSVRAAYLDAAGTLGLAPGDYTFRVTYEVCPPGLPQDDYFPYAGIDGCRTFGVGANGLITRGVPTEIAGEPCLRANGIDAATGGITVGIAPLEQSALRCSPFRVQVIPVGGGIDAATTLFFDAPLTQEPPPGPVCGNGIVEDGEACDDGNEADHDGCSALCQVEPDCHPMN